MRQQALEAEQILRQKGKRALYRIPWFLLLGDADAGQRTLLQAASSTVPVGGASRDEPSGAQVHWRWWVYEKMVAIESSAGLVRKVSDPIYQDLWAEALQVIKAQRPLLPLNGILVLVSADALRGSKAMLRDYSLMLQRRVMETANQLRVKLPVYVIVTRCDALPGFGAYAASLPREVREQVLGYRLPADRSRQGQEVSLADEVFESIRGRLHAVRLGLLDGESDPEKLAGIFHFVEAFGELKTGFEVFIEDLFDGASAQPVFWRGLYLPAPANRSLSSTICSPGSCLAISL